jgi:hypothetical protein
MLQRYFSQPFDVAEVQRSKATAIGKEELHLGTGRNSEARANVGLEHDDAFLKIVHFLQFLLTLSLSERTLPAQRFALKVSIATHYWSITLPSILFR